MSQLEQAVNLAPNGMDSASQPTMLPPNRACRIVNLLGRRAGMLRGSIDKQLVHSFPSSIDGVAYYFGETAEDDRLLVVSAGSLWVGQEVSGTWNFYAVGSGFAVGKKVRHAYFDTETIFVQDGGLQPLRYDGVGLYQLGISAPASAPTVYAHTASSGTGHKTGKVNYCFSLFDSRYRESDVSSEVELNFSLAANSGKSGWVTVDFGDDPQVFGAYVYARNPAGTVKYRIGTLLKAEATVTLEDNLTDNLVSAGTSSPLPGQFGVPQPASCIANHKRHVFLNDVNDSKAIQYNNLDAPTQWAQVGFVDTDGGRLQIGTHLGAGVTALEPFGSLLGVWTASAFLQLWGDTPSDFLLRPVHKKGVLAPSTALWCDNAQMALMGDGRIWLLSQNDGFLIHPADLEIEPDVTAHTAGEKRSASAAFVDNRYVIAIGEAVYVWDFASPGWSLADLGGAASDLLGVERRDGTPVMFAARGNDLLLVDFNSSEAVMSGGAYHARGMMGRSAEREKRGKAFRQMGRCKAGTVCTAILTVALDQARSVSFPVTGPFDAGRNILFYQEFFADEATANEFQCNLTEISGTGIVLERQRLDYSEVG